MSECIKPYEKLLQENTELFVEARKLRARVERLEKVRDIVSSPLFSTNDHKDLKRLTAALKDCEEILATDWEIEERKIEITEREFDTAISEVSQKHESSLYSLLQDLKYRLFDK